MGAARDLVIDVERSLVEIFERIYACQPRRERLAYAPIRRLSPHLHHSSRATRPPARFLDKERSLLPHPHNISCIVSHAYSSALVRISIDQGPQEPGRLGFLLFKECVSIYNQLRSLTERHDRQAKCTSSYLVHEPRTLPRPAQSSTPPDPGHVRNVRPL